ncbi:unnamed protein product [Closterium sp. Naga37s-1]|nr:unnamed protein product [Closterium sp. Naga37s-1]
MEAFGGPSLFRVADATGDAVTTIANIASVSRAFARAARSDLWPRYCLARAALAEDGEAAAVAAVAARLVRDAASADAPPNAASSLARCMSARAWYLPAPTRCESVGEVEGGKKRKEREDDGGKGAQEGAALLLATGGCGREHGGEGELFETSLNQEGAAVLMAAGGCGEEHEDEDDGQLCHVVRGAIAGFRHSR